MKRHWTESQENLAKEHKEIIKAFYVDLKNSPQENSSNLVKQIQTKEINSKSFLCNKFTNEYEVKVRIQSEKKHIRHREKIKFFIKTIFKKINTMSLFKFVIKDKS